MNKITDLFIYNDSGMRVLSKDILSWREQYPSSSRSIFGPIVKYSWTVGSEAVVLNDLDSKLSLNLLPDLNGFIVIEKDWKPDNCLLLDAYGKERMRLSVPWQMTGAQNPAGATFGYPEKGYPHPVTGDMGSYGINGWVGQSKFYFELNYKTGEFLWCRQIRD
jgi:hypothetical protein